MPKLQVSVLTYRSGLLARLGHDLYLQFERGALTFSSSDFHLELAADSLRCLGSRRRNGQVDRIDSADAQEIERRIRDEVFACSTYPSITASGKLPEISPAGEISLEIRVEMRGIRQTLHHASQTPIKKLCIDIRPSRWGIAPIRALAGTLRLEDRVTIELNLETPWPVQMGQELKDPWRVNASPADLQRIT